MHEKSVGDLSVKAFRLSARRKSAFCKFKQAAWHLRSDLSALSDTAFYIIHFPNTKIMNDMKVQLVLKTVNSLDESSAKLFFYTS